MKTKTEMPLIEVDADSSDEWFVDEELASFNELFNKVFPKGMVGMIAKNHGWRKLDGFRYPEFFKKGVSALSKCTLNGEASFKVFVRRNKEYGYHIAINTAHHDSPCWDEWTYLVRPKYVQE
jgi:hypothetical protein